MLRHQTTWLESGDHRGLAFKYLCWSPRSQMEMVQLPMKNSWLRSLQKWLDISPGLLKKRHVLCTKCDMPYLVSTMDVSVFAEMLSANIVSWAVRASGLPPKSLQIACSRTSRHLSCLHHTMESEIFGLFYQRSFIDLFGKMAYWGQIWETKLYNKLTIHLCPFIAIGIFVELWNLNFCHTCLAQTLQKAGRIKPSCCCETFLSFHLNDGGHSEKDIC